MGKSKPTDPSQNTCFEGGNPSSSDGPVEVRTGVTASVVSQPVASNTQACQDPGKQTLGHGDGITIKINCSKNPHLVQFIYREMFDASGHAISRTMHTTGGTYQTTTDPANPNWNTDSNANPNPNYDAGFAHRTDPDALTTYDEPTVTPQNPGETSRATFKAYAICDGKVIREINWVREQKDGQSPTYTSSVAPASDLPDWAKKQLQTQGFNAAP